MRVEVDRTTKMPRPNLLRRSGASLAAETFDTAYLDELYRYCSLTGGLRSVNKPTRSKRSCASVRPVSEAAAGLGFPGLSASATPGLPATRRARSVSGSLKCPRRRNAR
jgi:hypothetical protein